MPDYKKGKIYRIICNITGKIYIGSTIETLARRLSGHRRSYKLFKEGQKYKKYFVTSFQIIEQGEFDIVLIENYPCESKVELHRRERFFIESLECVNKNIPTRTPAEYRLDNKDALKEKAKQYQQDNKDDIMERRKQWRIDNMDKTKQYRIDNRDKTKQYTIDNKETKKQYRIDNKEHIKEKQKQYRLNNKDAMNEKRRKYRLKKKTENEILP